MTNASTETSNSSFRSWIDQPAGGKQTSTRLVVRGWCYHRGGSVIKAIRGRTRLRTFHGTYGDERPDVSDAFGAEPASAQSGYEIPVSLTFSPMRLRVEAQLPDGEWHHVQMIPLYRAGVIAWPEPLKWSRFWLKAWLGRPTAWSHLSESERDFVVQRVRLRNWLNLFVGPHHAPTPLVPEQFPPYRLSADRLPRMTIVTPSFQQGPFLEQTIQSVLDQRDVHVDYVVHDGGSTDGSLDVIRRYAPRLTRWESAPDEGQAAAVARGFVSAGHGADDVMMYLNSDDVLMQGALRFVAEYFALHPDVDVVYGHRILIDDTGREVGRWLTPRPAFVDLRMHDFVPQETLFWRRRIWDRVGGIDPSFKFALDWDLLLRFKAAGAQFARLPWFLAAFRIHPGQKTNRRLQEEGIPEMDALRHRTLGRAATHDELHLAMRSAEVDSALVYALWRRGWRI